MEGAHVKTDLGHLTCEVTIRRDARKRGLDVAWAKMFRESDCCWLRRLVSVETIGGETKPMALAVLCQGRIFWSSCSQSQKWIVE